MNCVHLEVLFVDIEPYDEPTISDDCVDEITQLRKLQTLVLTHTNFSTDSISKIFYSELTNLEIIDIRRPNQRCHSCKSWSCTCNDDLVSYILHTWIKPEVRYKYNISLIGFNIKINIHEVPHNLKICTCEPVIFEYFKHSNHVTAERKDIKYFECDWMRV